MDSIQQVKFFLLSFTVFPSLLRVTVYKGQIYGITDVLRQWNPSLYTLYNFTDCDGNFYTFLSYLNF